jgi:hypothetical protein
MLQKMQMEKKYEEEATVLHKKFQLGGKNKNSRLHEIRHHVERKVGIV